MRSRITATGSFSRLSAGRRLRSGPLLLAIVALAAAMAVGPAATAEARGVPEPGNTPGATSARESDRDSAPPENGPPAFTDELRDTPCPCSGDAVAESVRFSVLASGANAAQQERLAATATSQGELEKLWSRVARTRIPQPEPPEVRFDSQTAVAIFMGQRPSGGYSIEVDAACRVDASGTVNLCYTAYEPPEDAIVTMALTSPYAFVIIDEPAADVVVHRRNATR
ncbi:MAG: protease complex subunit PrcB family protein [Spirochaetia bacterium]